jgi:hypothetical protein
VELHQNAVKVVMGHLERLEGSEFACSVNVAFSFRFELLVVIARCGLMGCM